MNKNNNLPMGSYYDQVISKPNVVKTTQKGGNKPKQVKKTTQKGGG